MKPPASLRVRHVVIVGDFADVTGGQAKVAIDSAVLLADRGLRVTFFAACGPVSRRLQHDGIKVVCLNQPTILDDPKRLRAMRTGIWNRAARRALADLVADCDPRDTVLHCHGYAKSLSPSIGPVLTGGALRSVFTMHEYFLACPNGGFYDYRKQAICTRKPLSMSCLSTNCDVRHPAHKAWRVARAATALGPGRLPRGLRDIIAISDTQDRAMRPYLPDSARMHRVSNPVEAGGAPVAAQANRKLVFVGRLSPEKGALMLAEAAVATGDPVLFIGDGPDAGPIRRMHPGAEITGWLAPDAVQARLAEARALVFPSLWYEGQPLVPLEALLRGIPVVAGGWTAAAEEIRDGENGVIYADPTAAALTAAIRRLPGIGPFDSTALAARVAPAAHADRLIGIYDDMLARDPGRP